MQKENKPTFHHPEVDAFYQYGMDIPQDKVKAILELPRETLVKDMEAILQDAVDRYEYFSGNDNIPFEEMCFPHHALWTLADLNAEEALPTVLNLLRQGEDVPEFWFADAITENIWEELLAIANHKLELLSTLFFEPENSWIIKIQPSIVACQVALHFPERREEVIKWYRNFLERLLLLKDDDRAINGDAISSLVVDLYYINAKELLPEIKKLYERGWVFIGVAGTYEDIAESMEDGIPGHAKRKMRGNIFGKYKYASSNWLYYREPSKPNRKEQIEPNYTSPDFGTVKRTTPKIGRNDPCTCGSGKKYKKCCLNK